MANTLGYYNPYFYANEALIWLKKALGMAARVHMGYDAERRAFGYGEYVNIRRPGTFTATDVNTTTGGTTADITPDSVQVQLSEWKEVKFKLTDKELALTRDKIVNEHIGPQVNALADAVDTALAELYIHIGPVVNIATSTAIDAADITSVWQTLFNHKAPMNDLANMHFMVDGTSTKQLLDDGAFTSWSTAGSLAETNLLKGTLGQRLGFNFFSNQNVQTHSPGAAADTAGAIAATSDTAKGSTELVIDDLTDTQDVNAGDTFTIEDDDTTYSFTEDATVASNTITVGISPPLQAATAEDKVVTIVQYDEGPCNLAFHKNAFALVTAPLSELGNEAGAKIATIQDPDTGLSIRSRLWYDGLKSTVYVGVDILYGVVCLDGRLGCKVINTP
jgi:hypothetical protein